MFCESSVHGELATEQWWFCTRHKRLRARDTDLPGQGPARPVRDQRRGRSRPGEGEGAQRGLGRAGIGRNLAWTGRDRRRLLAGATARPARLEPREQPLAAGRRSPDGRDQAQRHLGLGAHVRRVRRGPLGRASSPPARCSAPPSTTSATPAATAARARGAATATPGAPRPRGPRCRAGAATARSGRWCKTMYEARRTAISRMVAECAELGGHGVVGVRLTIGPFPVRRPGVQGDRHRGRARRARRRSATRSPPTCPARTSPSWCTSGWMPAGLVLGISVAARHDDWLTVGQTRWSARERRGHRLDRAGQRRPPRRAEQLAADVKRHRRARAWSSPTWTCACASASARPRRAAAITSLRRSTSVPRSSGFRAVMRNGRSPLRSPSCPSTRSDARRRGSISAQNRNA